MRHVEPAEARRPLGAQHISAPPIRHSAGRDDLGRLAAAKLQHQPRRDLQPIPDKSGIEAALEAIAGVARNVELAARRSRAHRVEERRLDEHLDGRFGACGRLTTDHPAETLHAGRIGNDRHFRIERIFLAVEREQGFARPRQTHRQIAGEPAGIKHMKRPVEVKGQEIGDVDERRDRPQPDRFELVLQPCRARPVMDAANVPPEKQRASRAVLDIDADRRPEMPGNRGRIEWPQTSEAGGGEIAGDAADPEAVGTVRRHLDVEDGVAEADEARIGRADRRILRQFDDPFVIVAEAELVGRAQHAPRRDAADHGFLQHRAGARDDGAGGREDALHPGVGVRRPANHLNLPLPGIDDTDLQPVGIRMRFRRHDRGHCKRFETSSAVLHTFQFMAEHREPFADDGKRRLGFEMFLQPGERRLHAAPPGSGPRTSEGISSGRKP